MNIEEDTGPPNMRHDLKTRIKFVHKNVSQGFKMLSCLES